MRSAVDETYSDAFTADEDRMLVLGNALLSELENFPDSPMSKVVLRFLDGDLTDSNERALFNLAPLLSPDDDKVVPLKTY
jgi:hypothetical protein